MASNKKLVIFSIAVVVLLVLAVGYIGFGIYSEKQLQKQILVYQQGVQAAITQIYQSAAPPNCQQVPIFFNNQTINIIAVECLTAPT